MSRAEIEAALQAAIQQCEAAACPLSEQQQEILLEALWKSLDVYFSVDPPATTDSEPNPLDELTAEERQALLQFILDQENQNRPWKIALLNDWLQGNDSGSVQFIRDRYGVQWLEQVRPCHIAYYRNLEGKESVRLKVGDRIEVTNGLWEWVQEEGPCSREWFPCLVIQVNDPSLEGKQPNQLSDGFDPRASCLVRFETGAEYEIQGIYDWNRSNWRWLQE
jgi:hypothetical protein